MRPSFIIGAVVVAVGIILAIQYWPAATPDAEQPASTVAEPTPAPGVDEAEQQTPEQPEYIAPPPPAVVLPSLAESDDFVRAEMEAWSLPEVWLAREDLISRAAVVIQNAADGGLPRRQLGFLAPSGAYPVLRQGERFFVDPQGYQRYDGYLDVLERVPPAQLAELLDLIHPLLQEALALLGDRRAPQDLVLGAVARVQALPELTGPIELLQPKVVYTYADPALEARPEFDKQLLRMGPDNLARLRAYVQEFKTFYPAR